MKIKHFMISILLILMLSSFQPLSRYSQAQELAYQEDFEDGQAQGWELESGWEVRQDGNNQLLAGNGHFWARSNQLFEQDYRLSFRLKLLSGTVHLVYRLNNLGRYYIGFSKNEIYLNKQYWPEEYLSDLATSQIHHALNTWHQIEIIGQAGTITLLVNGKQELSYTDAQPLLNGSFAFETLADSQAYVDDIAVTLDSSGALTAGPIASRNLSWIRLGGPLGGLGYDIRMVPGNPDKMFVTDAWAGVFASIDGGRTWYPSSEGITTRTGPSGDAIPVFSLTIDPNDPKIVWAGTQFTRGIFKSTDGGRTWQKKDAGIVEREGISFRGFSVMSGDSETVYAAGEISSWAWSPDQREHIGREFDRTAGVVYKTLDGGENWNAVWRGENLARYVWINPQDTDIVYISTGIFDREAANSDPINAIPGGEGVLKSTDGGRTWSPVNNGLDNLYVGSLFMHPTDPDILLAGTGNNQYAAGEGVYLTRDGGSTWEKTLSVNEAITAVEIAASNPDIAYAASRFSVYRSEDGGQTWGKVAGSEGAWGAPGVQTGFPIDFQVDPSDPNRIFTNAYGGGAFMSEDGGHTWLVASQGYTGAQVRDIAVDPVSPARVVVAARSGVFATVDGGASWAGINPSRIDSLEWNAIATDPSNPQHLIGGLNVGASLLSSSDWGKTWQEVIGLQVPKVGWRTIAFAPSSPATVYAGSAGYYSAGMFDYFQDGIGVYVSRDGGQSWSPANDNLSKTAHVCALAIDPADPLVVYAATANLGLLKTTDGGKTWMSITNNPFPTSIILSVAINPLDANIILVGLDRSAIYRSTDSGQSWSRAAAGLNAEASVSDIVFDPSHPKTIYLSDLISGVYRSMDGGDTWAAINEGLFSRSVNALAISSDGLHLYAATEGSGTYRFDTNGVPPEPIQVSQQNLQTSTPLSGTPTSAPTLSPTSASSIPSNIDQASPTPSTPSTAKPGICGSIGLIPVSILGVYWMMRTRRRDSS
jgi:photosystem II stability/assembly factor-like uncharacterized protein